VAGLDRSRRGVGAGAGGRVERYPATRPAGLRWSPGGRLALVAGRVTDQGEVLGNRELVLIGPDGTREPLGRGVLELLWAPA